MQSHLQINRLKLSVYLGYFEDERKKPQNVFVDMHIKFLELPEACFNDQLDDTICYATFIDKLNQALQNKSFQLIEHLAHFIYTSMKSWLPKETLLRIQLHKYPQIENLTDGVTFMLGDTL